MNYEIVKKLPTMESEVSEFTSLIPTKGEGILKTTYADISSLGASVRFWTWLTDSGITWVSYDGMTLYFWREK
jgi:hypothetical protein